MRLYYSFLSFFLNRVQSVKASSCDSEPRRFMANTCLLVCCYVSQQQAAAGGGSGCRGGRKTSRPARLCAGVSGRGTLQAEVINGQGGSVTAGKGCGQACRRIQGGCDRWWRFATGGAALVGNALRPRRSTISDFNFFFGALMSRNYFFPISKQTFWTLLEMQLKESQC